MRYGKAALMLGIVGATAFIGSFLLSYKLSPRGFFDFEKYIEDLREMGKSAQIAFSGDENAEGTEDTEDGETVKGEDGDRGAGKVEASGDSNEEDSIAYPNLKSYKGGNPYGTILSDRDIVKNMRYLLGAKGYSHLIKSIPNAKEVKYDEALGMYSVEGDSLNLGERLSGMIQVKENGLMYIAYALENMIVYHTNDEEFAGKLVEGSHMESWVNSNIEGRELKYMNKIAK